MTFFGRLATSVCIAGVCSLLAACGSGGGGNNGGGGGTPTTYILTINSTNPASGVAITVSPADNNSSANGSTSFTRTYNSGTSVTLTAPATAGANKFSSWTGCTSATNTTCSITMSGNMTVTAGYTAPGVTSVTVSPNPAIVTIGTTQQFSAVVAGNAVTDSTVTWAMTGPSGSSLSPGTISSSGLYTSPYPAPATITVTATSKQDSTVSGSVTVTLSAPAVASGPSLTVDVSAQTHKINPMVYGMNGWGMAASTKDAAKLPVNRWGGNATSRFNYKLNVSSSASDWYFENQDWASQTFDSQVTSDASAGAKTLGTLPVNGWVAKDATSCSYPTATYAGQQKVDTSRGCGNGVYLNGSGGCTTAGGCNITGNDATVTSTAINGATWADGWVKYLVGKFGTAANGGVAIYDLDNEPTWWSAVHRDVHPIPFTYDEVTNNGIAVATAVKNADPSAEVSGPVIDYWWAYFYSMKDIDAGWHSASPSCWQPWSNPVDRKAHGGVPFIEYYLQQFAAAEKNSGKRLLDYVDLHTYFVADDPQNPGTSLGFATAGNAVAQAARLNSTRVFWDPTYTDKNYPQPNYLTDSNYTTSCNVPLQAPQVIPMMKGWVAKDYPGTKLAITEYNWGAQEHINGALAQADILGIFGREGLDLGALWGAPDPATQVPGLMAFEVFRNYDGKGAAFGDMSITSTSADQGKLSVYGALRTSDNTVTLVVINKTYGDLTTALSIGNLKATTTTAKAYLYSNANLNAIMAQPDVTVTPPNGSSTSSTLSTTFPAQSITLLLLQN